MTNDELQGHINAIVKARKDGVLQESCDGEGWLTLEDSDSIVNAVQLGGDFKYRIKPVPRTVYLAESEVEALSEARVVPRATVFRKFREVIE